MGNWGIEPAGGQRSSRPEASVPAGQRPAFHAGQRPAFHAGQRPAFQPAGGQRSSRPEASVPAGETPVFIGLSFELIRARGFVDDQRCSVLG